MQREAPKVQYSTPTPESPGGAPELPPEGRYLSRTVFNRASTVFCRLWLRAAREPNTLRYTFAPPPLPPSPARVDGNGVERGRTEGGEPRRHASHRVRPKPRPPPHLLRLPPPSRQPPPLDVCCRSSRTRRWWPSQKKVVAASRASHGTRRPGRSGAKACPTGPTRCAPLPHQTFAPCAWRFLLLPCS